jgi:hypothetical protein
VNMLSTEVFAPDGDGRAAPAFGLSNRAHIKALAGQGFDARWAAGDGTT